MNVIATVTTAENRREYVLAEFRCALLKAKLAVLDIEAVACALSYNIISPEQAVAFFWDSEAVHFVGLELKGGCAMNTAQTNAELTPRFSVTTRSRECALSRRSMPSLVASSRTRANMRAWLTPCG
jgi:hypothetical protein